MEISKKIKDKNYVKEIVGSDIFKHEFKSGTGCSEKNFAIN